MEKIYFISYEVTSKYGSRKDMFEITFPRKIRNFNDVRVIANHIEEQLKQNLGECKVVVLNWKELEEPSIKKEEVKEEK